MPPSRVLLTDLDNTLFSWIDYFAPSFRTMVRAIVRTTGLTDEAVYAQFKDVYARSGSLEYPRAVEELALCEEMAPAAAQHLIGDALAAFESGRRRHLRAYRDVRPTLRWLRAQGVLVVAVTNSALPDASSRLQQLGLDALIHGVVAWDGGGRGLGTRGIRSKALPRSDLKPNPTAYLEALRLAGATASEVWVVGDSITKDLVPGAMVGATCVWARYGQRFTQRNFDTLLRVTHWSPEQVEETYDTRPLVVDNAIDGFGELKSIVQPLQQRLFVDVLDEALTA